MHAILPTIFQRISPWFLQPFLGQSGLAGYPLGSQSPVIFMLSVLMERAETLRDLFEVDTLELPK